MYEETLFQKATCGTPMVDLLKKNKIIPGIKVDLGVRPLYGTPNETVTQGIPTCGEMSKVLNKEHDSASGELYFVLTRRVLPHLL